MHEILGELFFAALRLCGFAGDFLPLRERPFCLFLLPTFRPVKQHPQHQISGEIFEAVHCTSRGE